MLGIKNNSISFTIIKKSPKDKSKVIDFLDKVNFTRHRFTNKKLKFESISGIIPTFETKDLISKTYIYETDEILILKEFNSNFFYSKRYLEQLIVHYQNSTIGMLSIYNKDAESDNGGEFRLIKESTPIVWIRSNGVGKQLKDFNTDYFQNLRIQVPSIEDKTNVAIFIENIIKKEFRICDIGSLKFNEISKFTLNELKEYGFFSEKEIEAIDLSFDELSEKEIYSGYGWGNNMPQKFRDEQMPSIKELSTQVLTLVSNLLKDNDYKYFKSKKSLNKKTEKGESIIALGTNGYGVNSRFNLIAIKRIDELAKSLNEFQYSNKLNSINSYKNYWTISASSENILLGEIIATSINSLVCQTISAIRLINEIILHELEEFESIEYLDRTMNSEYPLYSMNYFNNKHPFSRTSTPSINNIGIAIMNRNIMTDDLIEYSKKDLSNLELTLNYFEELKIKYGT